MSYEDKEVNRSGWLWMAPEYFSRWRIFPRGFIILYFWLCIETAMWFMGLPNPGAAQAAFASAIISAGAAWFGLYVNSGSMTIQGGAAPYPQPAVRPKRRNGDFNRDYMRRDYRSSVNAEPLEPLPDSETDTAGVPEYQIKGE